MPLSRLKPFLRVPASGPIAAAIWLTLAMALMAVLAAFVRASMNAGLHPFQVVFLRNAVATLLLAPLLAWRGMSLVRSSQLPRYGLRVAISLLSMQAWFYAISLIPIGEVTAISFLAPVLGTVGAIVLLGERVRLRRWTAGTRTRCAALARQSPSGVDGFSLPAGAGVFANKCRQLQLTRIPGRFASRSAQL